MGCLSTMSLVRGIGGLTIGIIVFTGVLMKTIKGKKTYTWSISEVALWGTVGLMGVYGILYGFGAVFGVL